MNLKQFIKKEASLLGFTRTGIAAAEYDPVRHNKYLKWLRNGHQAGMNYLERGSRARFDPKIHIPGASSVIVCSLNYYTDPSDDPETGYVSIYGRGDDYHDVMKEKISELCDKIKLQHGEFQYKIFVDTSPISEKSFAVKAGIGFIGKNSVIITPKFNTNGDTYEGSFHFLGIAITDLPLEPDKPVEGDCGECRICIDSCPTGAILENSIIDSRKCISYHNTQSKNGIPDDIAFKMGNMIFGCDICQLVCPFNAAPVMTSEPRFTPRDFLVKLDLKKALKMTEAEFQKQYAGTVLFDPGFERFRNNIEVVSRNLNY